MYCQGVYLRGCLPECLRYAVAELPEMLDETHELERTLQKINKPDRGLAHRLVQCAAVAFRPLRVEEPGPRCFSHSTSLLGRFRNFTKVGAWKILSMRCRLHTQVYSLSSMWTITSHTILSLFRERIFDIFTLVTPSAASL